jgi:hypothetical protein
MMQCGAHDDARPAFFIGHRLRIAIAPDRK